MTAKRDSTTVMWRVQWREARGKRWVTYATYETRSVARKVALVLRDTVGFQNTRVPRIEKKGRK